MFLIIGRDWDLCCQLVKRELVRQGAEVVLIDEDRLFDDFKGTLSLPGTAPTPTLQLVYKDREVCLQDVDGALLRAAGTHRTGGEEDNYINAEWMALVLAWMEATPVPVINRLQPQFWYRRHIPPALIGTLFNQLSGWLPEMIITNDLRSVQRFEKARPNGYLLAPLSTEKIYRLGGSGFEQSGQLAELVKHMSICLVEGRRHVRDLLVVGGATLEPEGAVDGDLREASLDAVRRAGLSFCRIEVSERENGSLFVSDIDLLPDLARYSFESKCRVAKELSSVLLGRRAS